METEHEFQSLVTHPEIITRRDRFLPFGNEYLAVPTLAERNAGIYGINVVHMGARGLIEFGAGENYDGTPFLEFEFIIRGKKFTPSALKLFWSRLEDWNPRCEFQFQSLNFSITFVAPPGFRGMVWIVEIVRSDSERAARSSRGEEAKPTETVEIVLRGRWMATTHRIFSTRRIQGTHHLGFDSWTKSIFLETHFNSGSAALAFASDEEFSSMSFGDRQTRQEPGENQEEIISSGDEQKERIFRLTRRLSIKPGESGAAVFYIGCGVERDGACLATMDMRRHGASSLLESTLGFLRAARHETADAGLDSVYHQNLFHNYFFATANCIDTDEVVALTSRSPRYYVSGAFWERDSLLWSLPAITRVDPRRAREVLLYACHRHFKEAGKHAHYISGQVLYPGFELDQLAAYPIAIEKYCHQTRDYSVLKSHAIQSVMDGFESRLMCHKAPNAWLFRTFLTPTDDPAPLPYLTYDNVLVWRALRALAGCFLRLEKTEQAARLESGAERVAEDIRKHCIVEYQFNVASPPRKMYAYATNLEDKFLVHDEPGGSLSLLAFWGYVDPEDKVFRDTISFIFSEHNPYSYQGTFSGQGCPHFEHPSVFGVVNQLLIGHQIEAQRQLLKRASLDNGMACESFDRETGWVRTGAGFAAASGFLAMGIHSAFHFKKNQNQTTV